MTNNQDKQYNTDGVREVIYHIIPLGEGNFARMTLPRDLTAEEADRLCGVLKALAFTKPATPEHADV